MTITCSTTNNKEKCPLPDGFILQGDGLYYDQGEGKLIRLCAPLLVTARTRDNKGENHGKLLEFYDCDNKRHAWLMPMEFLASDGLKCREVLLSKGLNISTEFGARKLLTIYLQKAESSARIRSVDTTGWHDGVYILPDETIIGSLSEERLRLREAADNNSCKESGSLEQWQESISLLCEGNSRLVLAISAAFAAPLLYLLGEENGGFHFRGGSSLGKTTALRVASSVYGSIEYLRRWRATSNGLEAVASLHNDTLLCLDELGQVEAKEAGEIAYMLANGSGKSRANCKGNARTTKSWRLLFLSSGEISLSDHMTAAGKKTHAGQETRLVDIPADTGTYGLFDTLHDCDDGDKFSKALALSCAKYYGTPIRAFLKGIIEMPQEELKAKLQEFCEDFISEYVPEGASGQAKRVGRRFALVAAGGELATALDITCWEEGEATKAAAICYEDWIKCRGGTGLQEEKTALSQVRHFFEQHGDSRFALWDYTSNYTKTINRAGYKKVSDDDGIEFFVFIESFRKDICSGLDHKFVAKVLIKHGLLMPEKGGRADRSERLPNSKKKLRVYRITSKVLEDE